MNDPTSHLLDEIDHAYQSALYFDVNLDRDQLTQAINEAKLLARSFLFGTELIPDVSLDSYGEFTFSHNSDAGYIDIGVRGVGELSYHVRNNFEPENMIFDDYHWRDFHIPKQLCNAIWELRRHQEN